jgi:hypothetical protein
MLHDYIIQQLETKIDPLNILDSKITKKLHTTTSFNKCS